MSTSNDKAIVVHQQPKHTGKRQNPPPRPVKSHNQKPKQPPQKKQRVERGLTLEETLAAYILDPQSHANCGAKRYPRGGTAVPTAAMTPTEKVKPDWNNTAQAPAALDSSSALAMVFRDINRGSIIYYQNKGASSVTGQTYSYDIYGRNYGTQNVSTAFTVGISPEFIPLPYAYGLRDSENTFAPHGDVWCAGAIDNGPERWFWIGKGSTLHITVKNLEVVPIDNVEISLIRWTPLGGFEMADATDETTILAGATKTYDYIQPFNGYAATGAYYTVGIKGEIFLEPQTSRTPNQSKTPSKRKVTVHPLCKGNSQNFGEAEPVFCRVECTTRITGTQSVYGHRSVFGFSQSPASYEDVAIIASSLWFENTAAESYRNGSVYTQQVPRAHHWLSWVGDIEGFIAKARTKESPAKDGFFGALLPSSIESFDLRNTHECNATGLVDSYYNIKGSDDYVMMYVNTAVSELGTAQKGTFLITHGGEYTTNDPTRELAISNLTGLQGLKCLDILRTSQQFHKNRVHARDIMKGVKRAYNIGKQIAKTASPFLEGAMSLI